MRDMIILLMPAFYILLGWLLSCRWNINNTDKQNCDNTTYTYPNTCSDCKKATEKEV